MDRHSLAVFSRHSRAIAPVTPTSTQTGRSSTVGKSETATLVHTFRLDLIYAVLQIKFSASEFYGDDQSLLVAYAPFIAWPQLSTNNGPRFEDERITDMAAKKQKKSAPKLIVAKATGAMSLQKTKTKAKAKADSKPKAKTVVKPKAKTVVKPKAKTVVKPKAEAAPKATAKPKAKPREVDSPFKNFIPYEPKRGEAYMDSKQLDHFRDILLNWRQELMEEVDRTVHHMQDEAANFPDPADRATQEEEFSIELRTRDRERKLIKKIDQTIERIDQEDYGYCDTCGVDIGLRRLEARPTATQCVDCKTLDEIKERQLHG